MKCRLTQTQAESLLQQHEGQELKGIVSYRHLVKSGAFRPSDVGGGNDAGASSGEGGFSHNIVDGVVALAEVSFGPG